MDRLEHARVATAGVEVAARREADASTDGCANVSEDVAEEVVGDDDVEALGLGDEEHRRRIHMLVVGLHVRVVSSHTIEGALP